MPYIQRDDGAYVPAIDARNHVRTDFADEMARGLVGLQVAAHGEDRLQVTLGGLLDLRLVPRNWAKMPCEVRPVLDVGQDIKEVPCGEFAAERTLQGNHRRRDIPRLDATQHRLAIGADRHISFEIGKRSVNACRGVSQPLFQLADACRCRGWNIDLGAKIRETRFALDSWQQVLSDVGEGL
jgi:hypothetical protein